MFALNGITELEGLTMPTSIHLNLYFPVSVSAFRGAGFPNETHSPFSQG